MVQFPIGSKTTQGKQPSLENGSKAPWYYQITRNMEFTTTAQFNP